MNKFVRIWITRATAPSNLQYLFAIYGLYPRTLQVVKAFTRISSTVTLYWTENGVKGTVGYIQIVTWPFLGIGANNKTKVRPLWI